MNLPIGLAESIPKGWGQQKPGARGWDNIVPKQISPTLWTTTQTCLSESWHNFWLTRSSHPGLSHHGAPPWPPSCCQLSRTGRRCGCHDSGHNARGPTALPLTSLGAQGAAEGSIVWQEKVTQIKNMCSCVRKPNAASSSHHPHHRAGRYLQCSPQHSSLAAGGLTSQEHLSHHNRPRWLHHVPSEHGLRLEKRGPART